MELFIQYSLYIISCVCIFVPFFGFGLGPPVIIGTAVSVFAGNAYALIAQKGILKNFIKDKKRFGTEWWLGSRTRRSTKAHRWDRKPGFRHEKRRTSWG